MDDDVSIQATNFASIPFQWPEYWPESPHPLAHVLEGPDSGEVDLEGKVGHVLMGARLHEKLA